MIEFILAVLAHLSRCLAGMLLNKTCKVGCAAKIQSVSRGLWPIVLCRSTQFGFDAIGARSADRRPSPGCGAAGAGQMGRCDTKLLGVMGHCGSFQLWRSQVGKNREISRIDAFCFAGECSGGESLASFPYLDQALVRAQCCV